MKKHKVSEEVRRKLSISAKKVKYHPGRFKKGHKTSKEIRKKIGNALKGRKWSEETKRKMKEFGKEKIAWNKNKKCPQISGEKNGNFKGGITPENKRIRRSIEYRLWREAVFARDNWTCQKCGDNKGGNLIAHHIQGFANYPELRTSIENGITLCRNCHRLIHKELISKNRKENFLKTVTKHLEKKS